MNKYDVSIIVPVYNSEENIDRCINSVFNQNYDFEKIELILVDNNSTDESKKICLGYAYEYDNIHVYEEKRPGVSFARNRGIDAASGKYIMFIDSDDYIGKNTVKNVLHFFEANEKEIDLVTYHETKSINGKKVKDHIRYNFLRHTGIYNLTECIFALQVRINICIKKNTKIRFDTSMKFQEDQKFCTEVLEKKRKIGYVREGEYYYEATSAGLAATYNGPMQYFESTTAFFEKLFSQFNKVPQYYHALFWFFDLGCRF